MKNKYFKSTQGINMELFVTKAVAYSTQATYELFSTNASVAEGEIGVFLMPVNNKEKDATITTAPLTSTSRFFIAQKRDGIIHRTRLFTYNEIKTIKQAFSAPVRQVTTVGFNGVNGSMNTGTLVPNQLFSVKLVETTPASQPYPSWNFEEVSKVGSTLVRIGTNFIKQVNSNTSPQNNSLGKIASAELLTNGTFTVATVSGGNVGVTKGSTTVTATGHNVLANEFVRIGGTTGAFPVYRVISVSTNSFELDTPYQGTTNTALTIANLGKITVITEIGFKFTAIDLFSSFEIVISGDNSSADIQFTTPYRQGSGSYEQVIENEKEAATFSGYTTANIAFTEDYGVPTFFAVAGTNYDYIDLNYTRQNKGTNSSNEMDVKYGLMRIITPNGVAPTATLNTIFA